MGLGARGSDGQRTGGWWAKRRERRQIKRERTGDSPEKRSERKAPGSSETTVKDAANRAGLGGFVGGG
jgi:hypothetical protein